MKYLLSVAILLSSFAAAQTYNLNLDQDLSVWHACILPSCNPGGNDTVLSTTVLETGAKWPANSLKLSELSGNWGNALFWDKVGASDANYFIADFWVYPVASEFAQAYEFDMFAFNSPYRWMFGSQCVVGGVWDGWDDLHNHWIPTKVPCELKQNEWHHIQQFEHRVANDTSCDGMPCMYFDVLIVDGAASVLDLKEPASFIPAGWGNDSGIQFQLDRTGSGGTQVITEYVRDVNFLELP